MSNWPRIIYVATTALGVYVTEDFSDPSVQPTWSAINTGLAANDCEEFWLDPFHPRDRQYVLLDASRDLYRRENGGNWTTILTAAQCAAATGQATTIRSFSVDAAVEGRIYVLLKATAFWQPIWSYRSDDYGATWGNLVVVRAGNFTYGCRYIRGHNGIVYASLAVGAGASFAIAYSSDNAESWVRYGFGLDNFPPICLNPLLTGWIYTLPQDGDRDHLVKITSTGGQTTLQLNIGPMRLDSMWFHPTDADHQRVLRSSTMFATDDQWVTESDAGAIAPGPYSFSPYSGLDPDASIVGLSLGTHVIGTLDNEADTTATGIAGANAGSAPYTDSIPKTCGGAAQMGIQAVDLLGKHTHIYLDGGAFELPMDAGVHLTGGAFEEPAGAGVHLTGGALEEPV